MHGERPRQGQSRQTQGPSHLWSCRLLGVGVNMYVDDEGSIRGLPRNLRASEIAACCGKPLEVGWGARAG